MPSGSFLNAGLTPFGLPVVPDEYNIVDGNFIGHACRGHGGDGTMLNGAIGSFTRPIRMATSLASFGHCDTVNPPMPHSRCGEYGALKKISASATGILAP
jgi:hypothetical protein